MIPLGIMAVMLAAGLVMLWRGSLRRHLSDDELARFLEPAAEDRQTLHAAEELTRRIDAADPNRKKFYPAVLSLAEHPDPEKRKAVAWLMGRDTTDPGFEQALLRLIEDPAPLVRFNAAPSLALHQSPAARPVLLAMLEPAAVLAPDGGVFHPKAKIGEIADWRHPLGMVEGAAGSVAVDPPTPGRVLSLAADGTLVVKGAQIGRVSAGQAPALVALGALTLPGIGRPEDAEVIEAYLKANPDVDVKVKDQAREAILAVKAAK